MEARVRITKKLAVAAIAAGSMLALSACGATSGGGGSASGYGDCHVYGKKGSIHIKPVTPGVLTVQTNLPSPGWWKGTSPDTITGGYEYCLAANIAYRAGLSQVKVDNVSFDALVAGQTKNYDIAMAQISVTPQRAKVVNFSAPYFDSNIGILAPAKSKITAADIRSKKIGVQVGTTAVDWADKELKPATPPKLFQDTTSMVTAVSSGLVDAAAQDTAIMLGFAKNSNGQLKVIGQYQTGEHYAAIYPKGSKNAAAMDKAINTMHSDGTLAKLSKQWLGPQLGGDPNAVPVWKLP
jgi:polar amino acid transport system substrate-binding protein